MNLLKNGILIGEKDIPKKLEKKEVFTMLADKIISLRKKEGWTQEEFANQLKVSRQSVSKWEGNQSIPDVDKIVQMSQIFGVSIDYLLNDDMKEPEYLETNTDFGTIRQISLEEAHEYLQAVEASAKGVALGVVLCILSPAVLIVLLGASEQTNIFSLSENVALGIGITVLLLLVALAVPITPFFPSKCFSTPQKHPAPKTIVCCFACKDTNIATIKNMIFILFLLLLQQFVQ